MEIVQSDLWNMESRRKNSITFENTSKSKAYNFPMTSTCGCFSTSRTTSMHDLLAGDCSIQLHSKTQCSNLLLANFISLPKYVIMNMSKKLYSIDAMYTQYWIGLAIIEL